MLVLISIRKPLVKDAFWYNGQLKDEHEDSKDYNTKS